MIHKELVGVAYKESMSNLGSKCPCLDQDCHIYNLNIRDTLM